MQKGEPETEAGTGAGPRLDASWIESAFKISLLLKTAALNGKQKCHPNNASEIIFMVN